MTRTVLRENGVTLAEYNGVEHCKPHRKIFNAGESVCATYQ